MNTTTCFHCGNTFDSQIITSNDHSFCCNGCKTVYELFSEHDLSCYYDFQQNPGAIPTEIEGKYDYLDHESIIEKLVSFTDNTTQVVSFYIPHIHCSSCIWILENLHKLHDAIRLSQVNFPEKTVRITYLKDKTSLKEIVKLLASIGYEPLISLEDYQAEKKEVNRALIYKLGIAGFAFGNVMFLSFPEYFEVTEYWLEQYKFVFRWIMFSFSLPVVFYAANDYFISAYKGLKNKFLNIDVPIALGISVLFIRSTVEIVFDLGTGFFDSLTGLVFFLLLGKFFQQKTYNFLSFERDFKSYFPIAVTKLSEGQEVPTPIYDIEKGDRLLIRNQELIPVDGILIKGKAEIDYSFVTGESDPVFKTSGDKLFAGGKQLDAIIEIEVLTNVSQSYLTQLWTNSVFTKDKQATFKTLTDRISKHFTIFVLSIACIATIYWLFADASKALNVFTAVLIIACPCAIALAAPFTLGNLLRWFGNYKCYLKNTQVIEQLAAIDHIVFDKTGTLTTHKKQQIAFEGPQALTAQQQSYIKSVLRASNHTLSRAIYTYLDASNTLEIEDFKEHTGQGIEATIAGEKIAIGSATFLGRAARFQPDYTEVHCSIGGQYLGKFTLQSSYRTGIKELFSTLANRVKLTILSGDNASEQAFLEQLLPSETHYYFNQTPEDKLEFIAKLQQSGAQVLMIGDGLNDAGALAQSNVGISISEDINVFSPASDAILDATQFTKIDGFIRLSKQGIRIIRYCFIVSLLYNAIGLYFAVTGQLAPVIAAILMPLSSISVVIFTTIATRIAAKKLAS